ncbi:MAG: Crp/Fnr family transcriptional regulator [Chloroflexota bacterium]|nr:Crp/Fnr family transcriptional regulator [Chloroflexota bacterium]
MLRARGHWALDGRHARITVVPRPVWLIERDPDLASNVPPSKHSELHAAAVAPAVELSCGTWEPCAAATRPSDDVALFVLDGMIVNETPVGDRVAAELLAPGDIVHPWADDGLAPIARETRWVVHKPVTAAVIDARFLARTSRWPEFVSEIVGRCVRRTRMQAIQLLACQMRRVDERLLLFFTVLAERFGRVRPDGIFIPVLLTHSMIGEVVGAQRPSVTTALSHLRDSGLVTSLRDGWLLHHEPQFDALMEALRERQGRSYGLARADDADVSHSAAASPALAKSF